MFGIKTLVVGSGVVAVLWAMNSHASAGDVVGDVKNGVQTIQNGASQVQNGYQSVQNGYQSLQNGLDNLNSVSGASGVSGVSGIKGDNTGLGGAAVSISPASARPGQTVTITVPSCVQSTSGTAASKFFANNGVAALSRDPKGAGLAGTAQIASNAENGSWSVNITCDRGVNGAAAQNGVTSITIYGGLSPVTTPSNPPKAGGGGSVMKGDVGMTAGGVALVAGGVGYGLWSLRRRDSAIGTHVG